MKIGVLALQGAFAEHISVLRQLDVDAFPVRLPGELSSLDGLIIPGGESTTISKLMSSYNFISELKKQVQNGLPVFGTCAGMILMANSTLDPDVASLGIIDIVVQRNSFGRQKDSFHARLSIPVLGEKPFPGIFIRAPKVAKINDGVQVLASLDDGTIVAVQKDKLIATAFHPELTSDLRFHQYFLSVAAGN